MTKEDNEKVKGIIRKRLAELNTENCKYCGGFHQVRLLHDGMTIKTDDMCCNKMKEQANQIIRETRKEYGDLYFQKN